MNQMIEEFLNQNRGEIEALAHEIFDYAEIAEQEVKSEASPQPDPEGFKRLWAKLIKEHENGGPQ